MPQDSEAEGLTITWFVCAGNFGRTRRFRRIAGFGMAEAFQALYREAYRIPEFLLAASGLAFLGDKSAGDSFATTVGSCRLGVLDKGVELVSEVVSLVDREIGAK